MLNVSTLTGYAQLSLEHSSQPAQVMNFKSKSILTTGTGPFRAFWSLKVNQSEKKQLTHHFQLESDSQERVFFYSTYSPVALNQLVYL